MSARALRITAVTLVILTTACAAPDRTSRTSATQPEASATAGSTAIATTAATTRSGEPTGTPFPTGSPSPTPAGVTTAAGTTSARPSATAAASASAPAPVPVVEAARPAPPAGAMPTPVGIAAPPRRPSANPASAGFPPPLAKTTSSPPNSGGISRIVSPKFGLDHYIDVIGVVNNEMEAPDHDGSYAVGWYPTFGAPGVPGNAVFSAHETWNKAQGPFYFMNTAQPGDELSLVMANGERYTYQVMNAGRYTVDNIPMGDLLYPANRPASDQWITLITCGGAIVYHGTFGDYVDRDVVVARRVR